MWYRSMKYTCGVLLLLAWVFTSVAEQGMVLLKREQPGENGGQLVLKYVSDGREVVLEDCCVRGAKFSPDGKQLAIWYWPRNNYVINIDGSGRTSFGSGAHVCQWCANGYIYSKGGRRADDDPQGVSMSAHSPHHDNMGPHGQVYKVRYSKVEWSMDGTKGVYTTLCRCEGSGWGQAVFLADEDKEYALTSPCVGSISPHGDLLGKAYQAHHGYAVYPFRFVYRYTSDTDNTFYVGPPSDVFSDTLLLPTSESTGDVAWSKDPDVVTYTTSNPDQVWMYRWSTHEKTLVGDGFSQDYYPRELTMADTSLYLTPLALDFEVVTGEAETPKPAMVYVKGSHTLPVPTITGAPGWLNVTAEKFDDDNVYITNALNVGALPTSPGTYEATLTVSFDGFRQANYTTPHQYTVRLNVFSEPALSFTATLQSRYDTGDSIEIGYTADCERAGDKVNIAISIDSGVNWAFVDPSFLGKNCGENLVFSYTIPDSALFYYKDDPDDDTPGNKKAVEGNQCLIRLRAYHPGGPEVYSGLFGINDNVTASAADRATAVRTLPLHVALKGSRNQAVLSLRVPRSGTARVLDIQGRTVYRFAAEQGMQSVALPRLRAGCYLVEVNYAAGGPETAVVNLF